MRDALGPIYTIESRENIQVYGQNQLQENISNLIMRCIQMHSRATFLCLLFILPGNKENNLEDLELAMNEKTLM